MRSNAYIVGAIFLVIILVVYFGLFHNAPDLDTGDTNSPVGEFATLVGDVNNWERYDGDLFAVSYPTQMQFSDMSAESQTVFLTYVGPTQTQATEFFDGIAINFVTNAYLNSQSLADVANAQVEQSQEFGEILQPVSEVELGGVKGYAYEFSGQGRFMAYFLPATDQNYLTMTVAVVDPTNQGFVEVKDKILGSLEVK